jgi:alanyl-tRNA synthetase
VQTPLPGLIVHRGQVSSGEITVGAPAFAEIDVERRRALSRSHTATHLVHRALRSALGESAAQAGSENSPGRLRFDFTAQAAVPP